MADNKKKKRSTLKSTRKTRMVTGQLSWFKRPYILTFRDEKPEVFKAQVVRGPVIKGDALIAYAANAAHVPESTIKMAKDALFAAINYFNVNGHGVQVPGLGTFVVRSRVKTVKTEDKLEGDEAKKTILGKRVFFIPKQEIAVLARRGNIRFVENKELSKSAMAKAGTLRPNP